MPLKPDEIYEVADALHAEGVQPSIAKVAQRLGRGSFTTIQKYLKEWKPGEGAPAAPAVDMPGEVREAVRRFGQELWGRISSTTQGEIEAVRRIADADVKRVQAECDALVHLVDERQGRIDELEDTVQRLSTAVETETTARATLAVQLDERNGLLEELRGQVMGLQVEREDAREEVRNLDRNVTRAHERNEVLEGKLQGLLSEHRSLEEELQDRLSDMHRFRDERDDARREVKAKEQVEEELRRSLAKEEARGAELVTKLDDVSARFTQEVARRAALEEKLSLTGKKG